MARIVYGSWMVRYPLGGNLSWGLQHLLGLKDLGHDVFFVEKSGYAGSCYDPVTRTMNDDCRSGIKTVADLLSRFGLAEKWCFVDSANRYWGLSKREIEEAFRTADAFIDNGTHGSWAEEAAHAGIRVLIEGEPGHTQLKWANKAAQQIPIPAYDRYFTNGKNIGLDGNAAPTLGIMWGHMYSPVKASLFACAAPPPNASYSTVMNWRAHAPITFNGKTYGHKDEEFGKFVALPASVNVPMSLAVSGKGVPDEMLRQRGWRVRDGQQVTISFDSFRDFLYASRGEFSVCKNVYVAYDTGWFSDKSAAYLASGRPVVLQETGFSRHLPVGKGLFAVKDVEEAADAIATIESDYARHSRCAREIACEYLEAETVMKQLLRDIGI